MNNNSTVIPGVNMGPQQNVQPTPFAQGPSTFSPNAATAIPGVNPVSGLSMPTPPANKQGQVFGFLFSVSKTMAGEYWPLMLGANTLGRGTQNSIVLGEATVSDSHASIHVISRANKLIVYIKDDQSKTGTLLNGELLRGEADLKNGDIITIGEQYELYVVLINAIEVGLNVKKDFQPTMAAPAMQMPPVPGTPYNTASMSRPMATTTVVEGSNGPAPMGGHTVIMGGPAKM